VTGAVVFSLLILGYAAVSRRLERAWITSAMVFVVAGALLGPAGLGVFDLNVDSESFKLLTEIALAIALFSDAARINLKALRSGLYLPGRLLGIGLPLTIVLGALAAAPFLPALSIVEMVLLATILAPTDAALGQQVVTDERVPLPVRQGLNVESGLNDGIAVPIYIVLLELAQAEATSSSLGHFFTIAVQQIGIGILIGILAGAIAGWILHRFGEGGWIDTPWRQVVMLAGAMLAFSLADSLGGSGFIAAFVGGIAFGAIAKDRGLGTAYLSEELSGLLGAAIFLVAGAVALTVLPGMGWQPFAYAFISLTVVRMVPVWLACLGTRLKPPSVGFIGWFGPRGLASIVFGIGLLEASLAHQSLLIQTILATVVLSVFAHGISASPLAAVYGRWYERIGSSAEAEGTSTEEQRPKLGLTSSRAEAVSLAADEATRSLG
jgi:NhaP-type Na+/H+ or K+/H+ antiporter